MPQIIKREDLEILGTYLSLRKTFNVRDLFFKDFYFLFSTEDALAGVKF